MFAKVLIAVMFALVVSAVVVRHVNADPQGAFVSRVSTNGSVDVLTIEAPRPIMQGQQRELIPGGGTPVATPTPVVTMTPAPCAGGVGSVNGVCQPTATPYVQNPVPTMTPAPTQGPLQPCRFVGQTGCIPVTQSPPPVATPPPPSGTPPPVCIQNNDGC